MNGTPRMRSAWPTTPQSARQTSSPSTVKSSLSTLPQAPIARAAPATDPPLIPITLVDAPSQRMYTFGLYIFLLAWRLYDWWQLVVDEESHSIVLFLKWCVVDTVFLFGVPFLRIPWLEWSDSTSVVACFAHVLANGMLMFRVPLPIEGWLFFLAKTVFDKELAISENSVRPNSIIHNSSLIMGKQIINILPEGSVTMNPDRFSFCIDPRHPTAQIPLYFNQTKPKTVELLRIDFETNLNETITLSSKEVRGARKIEDELLATNYVAKKPGLYRLNKVIDNTKLEVQRRMSDTLVVKCPKASVHSTSSDKCLGDLSDLTMTIEGVPPMKIVYSRTANGDQSVHTFQSIQPENFASPLLGPKESDTLVIPGSQDVSWARSQRIKVPLNESMMSSGEWLYSVEEIHDAAGNIANFSSGADDGEHVYPKGVHLEQAFTVHERPTARLFGCDSRTPLQVAKGYPVQLPIHYTSPGRIPDDTSHTLYWKFSPLESLTASGDHGDDVTYEEFSAKNAHSSPSIGKPGLYTLTGVKSKFCGGQIQEPASCLLINPTEPQLSISSENINDKCAGKSIGLMVDLDLIGTPPFIVRYDIVSKGEETQHRKVIVDGLRYQLELKPNNAGHFKYIFTSVADAVYDDKLLSGSDLVLEQDVRPPASAYLRKPSGPIDGCIEEPVEMNVQLFGDAPFILEYELVHEGKKKKFTERGIDSDMFKIRTDPLTKGGEYLLTLVSVKDKTDCKVNLNSEAKFTVRRQRPKVSFGQIEGNFKTVEIEGRAVDLPLRLTGRAPWDIKYRNLDDPSGKIYEKTARTTNDHINISERGTYEIIEISDNTCPGTIDLKASKFTVDWFPRPQIKLADTAVLIPDGHKYIKRDVCEGDIDAVEVNLFGSSPYNVKYEVRHKPYQGGISKADKEFEAALGLATISMDTSKAGTYEYKFNELSDALYDHDEKKFTPLILEQKVNRKPTAQFTKPGQSYKYCKEELAGDEVIPIKLEGVPPFSLEVDIKHQSNSRPETVKIANIESNHYDFRIPHKVLSLGIHQVSVRKVRDSHGCQQKTEFGAPSVQVQVFDVPTISPLDSRADYCVGERIAYTLSGTAPFEIFYDFEGGQRKAKSTSTTFRRIAEKPGTFTITAVSDKASECKARTNISKLIHEMPSVKISKGRQVEVDIHEGGEAEILFEFWGTPPFEFTYTRSTNARRGHKSQVLETRHEVSYEHSKRVLSSQEGTYEVVAIKDKFCSFSTQKAEQDSRQRLLQY